MTTHEESNPTPTQRLIGLLRPEKRTIYYILLYALVIGFFSLTIPVGITAVFNLLANGAMYSATYGMMTLVLTGVIIAGFLLIGQLSLVEYLEQKIFLKNSIEFAYRLPRIRREALSGEHLPELVNRFFDVINLQKSLLDLLIELIAAVAKILFSVVLISFYHPAFLVFGLVFVIAVAAVILANYKKGVELSIRESEHKYETVAYLEKVADHIEDYRGNEAKMEQIVSNTDEIASKYLKARNDYFSLRRNYFTSSIIFRTVLFAAMLILGSFFVVHRQMTFGQFVAAEVVIVQIGYAIETVLLNLNTIFDMVTGAVKLSAITDRELIADDF